MAYSQIAMLCCLPSFSSLINKCQRCIQSPAKHPGLSVFEKVVKDFQSLNVFCKFLHLRCVLGDLNTPLETQGPVNALS